LKKRAGISKRGELRGGEKRRSRPGEIKTRRVKENNSLDPGCGKRKSRLPQRKKDCPERYFFSRGRIN